MNRRDFIKRTGIGLLGLVGFGNLGGVGEIEPIKRIYCHAIGTYAYPESTCLEKQNIDFSALIFKGYWFGEGTGFK